MLKKHDAHGDTSVMLTTHTKLNIKTYIVVIIISCPLNLSHIRLLAVIVINVSPGPTPNTTIPTKTIVAVANAGTT